MTPEMLKESARTLLALDANGVLVPHGIGALAREAIEKLLSALEAAERRAGEAEDAKRVWRRAATAGLNRAGVATPISVATDFHPSDLTRGLQYIQAERDTLRARVERLEAALKNIDRMTYKCDGDFREMVRSCIHATLTEKEPTDG